MRVTAPVNKWTMGSPVLWRVIRREQLATLKVREPPWGYIYTTRSWSLPIDVCLGVAKSLILGWQGSVEDDRVLIPI